MIFFAPIRLCLVGPVLDDVGGALVAYAFQGAQLLSLALLM